MTTHALDVQKARKLVTRIVHEHLAEQRGEMHYAQIVDLMMEESNSNVQMRKARKLLETHAFASFLTSILRKAGRAPRPNAGSWVQYALFHERELRGDYIIDEVHSTRVPTPQMTRDQMYAAIGIADARIAADIDAVQRMRRVLAEVPETVWHDDITLEQALIALNGREAEAA